MEGWCRLDAKLGALSNSLDTLDEPSRQLLQHSAQLWLTPAAVDRATESTGAAAARNVAGNGCGQTRGALVNGSRSDTAAKPAPEKDSHSDLPGAERD